MGQAQKKQETSARVRTLPPPLPRRSDVAPVAAAHKPRSAPPPPPAAALRISHPPRVSLPAPAPAVHLALLPQWEDANASLRPAPKKSNKLLYWLGSATLSLGAGALVAAGLMNVRPSDYAQVLPQAQAEQVIATELAPAPVDTVVPAAVEAFPLEDAIAINAEPARPQPIVIPMLTVTSKLAAKPAKPSKRGKVSKKQAPAAQLTAAQPDPRDEAEVETAPAAETAEVPAAETSEAQATTAAVESNEPAAPEVVEPQAPALPEKLTRDQVRGGLEARCAQVLACTNGTYGKVLADVTISAPGRVSNAVIEGTFAGTNAGSCMARVLRSAQFPAFSGAEISVRYPFSF